MKRRYILGGFVVIILLLGFSKISNKDIEIVKNLDIYCTLFRELNMFYVDDTDPEKLVNSSINSMLRSLDPYTTYIPEKEMDDFNFQTTGEYGGIGSLIRRDGDKTIIADPYEGFPAAKAGLRAGDILQEIDGKDLSNVNPTQVSNLLKGKPGTKLKIKAFRPYAEESLLFDLVREKIVINNVSYSGMIDKHTGYIRLSNFTTNAGNEVKEAYLQLKKNPSFDRLVLDLRANPGGLLIEAVRTCNLFVDKGQTIVSTKGKVKQWDNEYKTSTHPIDTEIPLIVLINRASASSAEIVAGALQDLDRAIIIGQRSFGKGLVQATRPLKYNAQLKVTTAKYYIPSGRCIQALDYSHRNEDGSVGYIPDTLITEYSTKNGRKVYDGGGIQPDIEVIPEIYSEIALRLYAHNIIFNYATKYRNENVSIDSSKAFRIDDQTYREFSDFVSNSDFNYETASEKALKKLISTAKREKYYQLSEEAFHTLEASLSHSIEKDLSSFKSEIQEILEEEIVGRYYYHHGQIESQMDEDVVLHKALEVIKNTAKIDSILIGAEGNLASN